MILSIDQSTSTTKGLVWDLDGKLLGRADVPHKQITTAQGWVEHDGMEILQNTYKAAAQAIKKASIDPEKIKAIGISNQRETAICWDRETGLPLYNAIVWQCGRATDITNELNYMSETIQQKTGMPLSPFFSGAKFSWMIRNVNEVTAANKAGTLCCGTIDSWLIFKLTGNFKTDYSNASRTQLLNLQSLVWDRSITNAFGINPASLAEICMSDSHFGETDLGILPSPVPIHGVMGDSHSALLANDCRKPFMAKATYGTGSSIMMNAGTTCPTPTGGAVASIAWGLNNKVDYVLEGNINYTGAVIKWLVDDIELLDSPKNAGIISQTVDDTGGVYLVPAFTGLGAPYFNNNARAAFLGMNSATKKAHLIRAAEECIAYQIRDAVEAINSSSKKPISLLRVDGGPTKDSFLMGFQSDILNIPIEVSAIEELSGMGVAFCAAIAMGLCQELPIRPKQKIEPSMLATIRENLYKGWKNAVATICAQRAPAVNGSEA